MNTTSILEILTKLGTTLSKVGDCRESKRLAGVLLNRTKDSDSMLISWHKTSRGSTKNHIEDVIREVVRARLQNKQLEVANGQRLLGLVELLSSEKPQPKKVRQKLSRNPDFERAIKLRNTKHDGVLMTWRDAFEETKDRSKNERFSKEKTTRAAIARFKTQVLRYAKDRNIPLELDFRRVRNTNKNQ